MLTKQQIIEAVKNGRESQCLDGRDCSRLSDFFSAEELHIFGFELKEGATHYPTPYTEDAVKDQLQRDVAFGFEKALNCRGISSSLMYQVVKMWLWVLEDDLQHFEEYAQYGLPLFKAVAVKYNFPNPIGGDSGSERKYTEFGDDDNY